MAGYATIAQVLAPFPRFQQNLPNGITGASIQDWIDQGKAEIRARFLRRNLDPDNPQTLGFSPPLTSLTTDQANVLAKFNVAYAISKFGGAAYAQLSEGELALVKRYGAEWDSMTYDVDGSGAKLRSTRGYILGNDGVYDALFTPTASHVQVQPQFAGVAGSDYDPRVINDSSMGTFHMFQKGQVY